MSNILMMRMSGRRKWRRLLQHLLWPRSVVRNYGSGSVPAGFDPAWGL